MVRIVKLEGKLAVQMRGGDAFQLCQSLHAALCLNGFGGFGFEAVDKGLQMFDLCLLFDIGSLLLRKTLRAFVLVKIVIAAVLRELLLGQFDGLSGGCIEEITVVGNDDLRAR